MGKATRERPTPAPFAADKLRAAGLRPTRQRMELAAHLFRGHDRHVTAESLHDEVVASGIKVSLATIYNTLHQFTAAGLLRQVVVDAARNYFDTNISSHQHFYDEEAGGLTDIAGDAIMVSGLPQPPEGMKVAIVDVVIRLRPISSL